MCASHSITLDYEGLEVLVPKEGALQSGDAKSSIDHSQPGHSGLLGPRD
jgi:hypothetical protein